MKTTLTMAAAFAVALVALADEAEWRAVARRVAEDGTVLLKNDGDALPLAPGSKVALFGAKTLLKCGGGSAEVRMPYGVELAEGLKAAGLEVVAPDAHPPAGIMLVTRFSKEGSDRPVASFDLTTDELAAVDDARRTCGKVVAVVNAGHPVDVKPLKERADAVLYAWFVGQEGGTALGRIVAGEVNPSARLADTLAEKVSYWPSDQYFHAAPKRLEYGEGPDVGYRYFNAKAPEKIVYPFGHGLSYTTFSESAPEIDEAAGTVAVTVANTGVFRRAI